MNDGFRKAVSYDPMAQSGAVLIRGSSCRDYTEFRTSTARSNMEHAKTEAKRSRTVSIGTVRRELGVLSAAINYWHKEHGPLDSVPVVTRPQPPEPKADVVRNRSEMARLLAGALGWYELRWTDLQTHKEHRQWRRDREAINRHTARFIVIGRYTANRPGATLKLHWMANTVGGWPDLEREIMFRKSADRAETKKRQPSVRMGRALLAHMRRWRAMDERARQEETERTGEPSNNFLAVVHRKGRPIKDIGKFFVTALDYAGLSRTFTPHILRHTRVTWWVEAGLPIEEVADAAGMTTEMVEKVYWHRSPHFQKRAAEA
ncbi:tyrosine-type recombinase/integrase [Devosia soli]|nr:tyrosine-type recombinase/integrase [Devosia soli]